MKRVALAALCLLLSACASGIGPVPPPVGATVSDIEPGRSRVTFRGRSRAPEGEVRERAMMRAADLALERGYDWFRIADRSADVAPPTTPRFSFGVGTASLGRNGVFGIGGGTSVGGEPTYVASLEVVYGRGLRPPGADVYDARAVSETLHRRLP